MLMSYNFIFVKKVKAIDDQSSSKNIFIQTLGE